MAYFLATRRADPRKRYMGQLPPGPMTSPWMQAFRAQAFNVKLRRGNALRRALGQDIAIDSGYTPADIGTSLDPLAALQASLPQPGSIAEAPIDVYSSLPNPTFASTPTAQSGGITAPPGTIVGHYVSGSGASVPAVVNPQGIATPGGALVSSGPSASTLLLIGGGLLLLVVIARGRR